MMNPEDFVKTYFPEAKPLCVRAGISPVGCLSQAALESGWGEHHPGGVWFGIKRWRAGQPVAALPALLTVEGNDEGGDYAAFSSFADAVRGYIDFIKSNPRYQAALQYASDWRSYVGAVAEAGYATDPEYLSKLLIIGQEIEHLVYLFGLQT